MILYFSASGNSRFIAEHAAALLEDEACSLNARIRLDQHDPLESARPYVLVCPTYAWRIPRIVEEHLRHTELKGSRQIYLLVSACGSSGNTGSYAARFFRSIGMEWMGWHTFYMPGSYVAFLEDPDVAHARQMNQRARIQLRKLVCRINACHPLDPVRVGLLDRFMSMAANPFFYRFLIGRSGFDVTSRCIGCGKCAQVCPLNNIQMVQGRPQWGKRCTHCMACIHQCPKAAVEFRRITIGKNRYYNTGE